MYYIHVCRYNHMYFYVPVSCGPKLSFSEHTYSTRNSILVSVPL